MNSKEIKATLKLAKECIESKDFATACIHCKNVLKHDRNNYMALVFFGASLQETDQALEAPKAFKKAIQVAPDQPLAWKGLAAFYEKQNNEADRKDLLHVYYYLLKLEQDISKIDDWIRKIGILLSLLTDEEIVTVWNEVLLLPNEKKNPCQRMFLSVLASYEGDVPEAFLTIVEYLLENYRKEDLRLNCIQLYKKYLKLIYKLKDFQKLLNQSKCMFDLYPDVLAGPEWYCKGYLEGKFESSLDSDSSEPSDMYITLLKMAPDSYLGFTCKGVDELACQELVAACETLTQAVALKPTYGIAWYLLTQAQIWLHRFSDSEQSARQCLEHWKQNNWNTTSLLNCRFWLAKALCEQNEEIKLLESIRIADEYIYDEDNNFDFLPIAVKACIKLKDAERYNKYMGILEGKNSPSADKALLKALWLKSAGKNNESFQLLLKVSDQFIENFEIWLELGIYYLENRNKALSLNALLKATKLNQWCHKNFRYLGHCYKILLNDLTKARRCYQKAFQLNPNDIEAGIGLSDVYRLQGMEEENMNLLTVATQEGSARWAWLKLGLHYLSLNKPVEAVSALRVAVRLDSNDKNVWESLGDAYLALGSYTAAVKSYQKVLEWCPDQVYPLLQIAVVKHLLGDDQESVKEFKLVLQLDPDSIAALRGHAISCLSLMKTHLTENLNGLAADDCQEAINSLTRALLLKKDLICVWKMISDACTLLTKLPSKYCQMKIPSWLWITSDETNNVITLKKGDILQLGIRCCCHAIALNPKLHELWYDLSTCYQNLANNVCDAETKKSTRLLALSAVKKSLMLKNDFWPSWNLLGIINMSAELKNYSTSQHAFIKANQLKENNVVPWCNLGALYLRLGDLKLANQCFTEAQRCDPDYIESWVGQAMLAEITGHHEAMDLYRHSTQLGFHPEGALGYANLVLDKVINTVDKSDRDYIFSIKNMNALPVACDAMQWYTGRYPNNPIAYNMLGLLLERLKLYKFAVHSFRLAALLLKSESSEDSSAMRDQVLLNFGRTLLKIEEAAESVKILKQIKQANFVNQCTLAAAYLQSGQLEQSYSTYESTLEWLAPNDESRSHVLVAMAGVLYIHQGHEDAKLLLMQACQLKPISIAGLFACCALGLLHSDLPLTELALKELMPYCDDHRFLANIALFQAYTFLLKGKENEAIRTLSKGVHRHPDNATLWLYLALLQLHLHPKVNATSAARCSLIALSLGRSTIDVSKVTSLVSLSHLLSGSAKQSLRSAVKAVRLYPDVAENWAVLVACVLSRVLHNKNDNDIKWLKELITHIRRRLATSRPITQWLSNCERKVSLITD